MILDSAAWPGNIFTGEWRTGSGGTSPVVAPATGDVLETIGIASPSDVSAATEVAADRQPEWAARPYDERAAVLRAAGRLWEQHQDELAHWLKSETGSVTGKAFFELGTAAQECYEAAALASAPYGELLRSNQPRLSMARRRPVGVVGVIAPFNAPLILSIRAVAPALALGNAVVLKPDTRTAVSGGIALARVFEEAGLPPGLLSVLPGGVDVGEAIVTDPRVPVIAFTGSTAAGRRVAALAADSLKRVHLELGGNSALVVLDDANLERAAAAGAQGSFFHQGQICMATSRHLVHESIAADYTRLLAERADSMTVGNPVAGEVDLGPIIDERQRDRIHDLVTSSADQGASVVAGGRYDDLFYRPTVLTDVTADHPVFREEIFGPVAPVTTFRTLDEAAALASSTTYGLSLGILTADVLKGLELADRIPSGIVHINDQTVNDEATIPFGGVGDSGTGSRHGGAQANLDSFTDVQWVTMRREPPGAG
ncbi:benzaldehyde dehydrogenase [Rudaeicoccus suwonensis]|uniref:Benzaldehyde dehydrogenase (NAD) n=1 Tax=Rudaeicoccus suwonensis TaxID=657409 RepID=A0A561E2Y1_9MICO|nr:benzaldehyde dehydrogenase [Rudaeicoccus suwonensis]TWE09969.1 benzaldehyde dehydrogenase (NAD) [Rudaeicoccus suwonensis]